MDGFSFVDEGLAGMPRPLEVDLGFLAQQGLSVLVSLTTTPVDPALLGEYGLQGMHLPIEDFHPPTLEQQLELVAVLQKREAQGERVGVHCAAGRGRTGTMLATWFVAKGMGADEAIEQIRALRPGSIETLEQEQAVRDFERHLAEGF